ncbi:MAG: ABC transporter permease subunit [Acidobacteria bacterium]|nr:ABC transporter permease subunit [Acidobacteriota bacterium]
MSAIRTIAEVELLTIARRRWTRLFTLAFGLIVAAVAYASGSIHELGGVDGFERTTVALVPLVLVFVPMVALLIGITGHAAEPGSEAYLFSQPVTRSEIVIGKCIGEVAAVGGAITLGLAAGAALLVGGAGPEGVPKFLVLVVATNLLAAVFVSIGALVAAAVPGRVTALGAGVFVWFCAVLLYDGLLLALAQWLTGRSGARVLFVSVFGNPTDLVRVLTLSVSGTPYVLGAAGESWQRFLGGSERAILLSIVTLLAWTVLPLEAARRMMARRDL